MTDTDPDPLLSPSPPGKTYPIRLGSPEEFARVRGVFQQAGFDDVAICRTLGIGAMNEIGEVRWSQLDLDTISPTLRWCILTFLREVWTTAQDAAALFGEEALDAFLALGLLRPAKRYPFLLLSPVWLYAADGFVVVSDRNDDPDGEPYTPPDDIVFPAIHGGTLRFLKLLPEVRGGDALDLCGGAGIGALHFSRTARSAVSVDVTGRSARFAEFNARLNDAPVESVCGDLYAAVEGRRFDVISAHPPYVPAAGKTMVFRDAGDSGEDITRRIIAGLPTHLQPGGTCVMFCVARDTEEQPFEQRARDWLGNAAAEFDVIFGLERVRSIEETVASLHQRWLPNATDEEMQALSERLRALATRQFVAGALVLRRYPHPFHQPPLRFAITEDASIADFERVLAERRG